MSKLAIILSNHLNLEINSLQKINPKFDKVLIIEAEEEFNFVKFHKLKIAFHLATMRNFAKLLSSKKYNVEYISLEDKNNSQKIDQEILRHCNQNSYSEIYMALPYDYRLLQKIKKLKEKLPLKILDNNLFLTSLKDFDTWAKDKKQLRLEFFYRNNRKKFNILLNENKEPIGGKWNYDAENRKVPKEHIFPKELSFPKSQIVKEVINLVDKKFSSHFGSLDNFNFAVTRNQALKVLEKFIKEKLDSFGKYQDAMIEGEDYLYHSIISMYINVGLLTPDECIKAAEESYNNKKAPIESVEGFIRQILGWREYVHGIYWHFMPKYKKLNFLKAKNKLPEFFWNLKTDMNCLKQCLNNTYQNSYAHHIQRLMVLGNFTLLTGCSPEAVNEWYLIVYLDAYEWVELPNVTGMILFADGGVLASKPYAASGAYINKMSNYCKNCKYSIKSKEYPDGCPFNYLYWNFLIKNKETLEKNQRMRYPYLTLSKFTDDKIAEIKKSAKSFLESLDMSG